MVARFLFFFLVINCVSSHAYCQDVKLGLPVSHMENIEGGVFTNSEKQLFTFNASEVLCWDTGTGKLIYKLNSSLLSGRIIELKVSNDDIFLLVEMNNQLDIIDLQSGQLLKKIQIDTNYQFRHKSFLSRNFNCDISEDSKYLTYFNGGKVFIENLNTYKTEQELNLKDSAFVNTIMFLPQEHGIVVGSEDASLIFWNFKSQLVDTVHHVNCKFTSDKINYNISNNELFCFSSEGDVFDLNLQNRNRKKLASRTDDIISCVLYNDGVAVIQTKPSRWQGAHYEFKVVDTKTNLTLIDSEKWDYSSGYIYKKRHNNKIEIISHYGNNPLKKRFVIDLKTGKIDTIPLNNSCYDVLFSESDEFLIELTSNTFSLTDSRSNLIYKSNACGFLFGETRISPNEQFVILPVANSHTNIYDYSANKYYTYTGMYDGIYQREKPEIRSLCFEIETGKRINEFDNAFAFSIETNSIFCLNERDLDSRLLTIHDIKTRQEKISLTVSPFDIPHIINLNENLAILNSINKFSIYNLKDSKEIHTLQGFAHQEYYDAAADRLIFNNNEDSIFLLNLKTNSVNYLFSLKERYENKNYLYQLPFLVNDLVLIQTDSTIDVFSIEGNEFLKTFYGSNFYIDKSRNEFSFLNKSNLIEVVSLDNLEVLFSLKNDNTENYSFSKVVDISGTPKIIIVKESKDDFASNLYVTDFKSKKNELILKEPYHRVMDLSFTNSLETLGSDSTRIYWDITTGKINNIVMNISLKSKGIDLFAITPEIRFVKDEETLFSVFPISEKDYIIYTPSGLFDASPESMELMYWTKGLEVIEFAQLKDRYWVPGLWEKVMNEEPLPEARNLNELKLQPEVEMGEMKDGKIPVTLIKRDGGFGKVSVFINGKEVEADARGENFDKSKETQTIWVDLKDHPNLQDGENSIAVKASSEDGFVEGRPVEKKLTMKISKPKPNFYAVVIGTGKYTNSSINLKYPEKDAKSMSLSLKLGAEELFGADKTHIYTLTTEDTERPTKERIKSVFKEIEANATSTDIVLVYLSGHGIAWGGDQGDFYYITTDATAANSEAYNDEVLRKNHTISTAEFTEYLNAIPALKQVMIIDACSSGKAVDNLMASRDVEVSQIKAIDRMKDRTGMFVISGSAADAASYEASRYGQGLLTYSILQAMKGAALREDQYFDVNAILNYARETVPQLAAGIGGIQKPQLLIPKGGSFDIGLVNEEIKKQIPLSIEKPVFVRSSFMDTEDASDVLGVSNLIDDQLNQIATRGTDGQLVFLDAREFPDSYRLSGFYTQTNGTISLKLKIKGPKESEHLLTGKTREDLVEQIIELIETIE